jgi:hypothetical protein
VRRPTFTARKRPAAISRYALVLPILYRRQNSMIEKARWQTDLVLPFKLLAERGPSTAPDASFEVISNSRYRTRIMMEIA